MQDINTQAKTTDKDERAKIHTAHMMSEYLFSLSMMCKDYNWHKTGMHLYAAGDELKQMLDKNTITQTRYNTFK
jgi:hypothetical protein